MSLINQMLQDLDARRAAHGVGSRLHNDVRPLPKARPAPWPMVLLVVIVLGLVAGFGYFAYSGGVGQMVTWLMPQSVPVMSETASPPVVVAPVLSPKTEPEVVAMPQPTPPTTAELKLDGIDVSLRLAAEIEPVAEAAAEPEPVVPERAAIEPRTAVQQSAEKSMQDKSPQPQRAPAPKEKALTSLPFPVVEVPQRSPEKQASPPVIERTAAMPSPRERAELEYRKAIAAADQGRAQEAEMHLFEVLRLDEMHAVARQLLVKSLLDRGKSDQAMSVLQEGLIGQPAQLGWAMSLARLQVDRGDLSSAWQTLDYSLPAAARNADYLGFAANVLQRLGRTREASEQYRRAATVAPGDGRWWLGLGLMLDSQGQSAEAREAFSRARACGNLGPDLLALIEQKLR